MGVLLRVQSAVDLRNRRNRSKRLQPDGVPNLASLVAGPVAPGEIVTLIGSGVGPALVHNLR
jgi:hypothetical protein